MIEQKIRMTRQRKAILEALRSVESHPTADEVYAMVRAQLPRISLGTVYRNLEELSRLGLIRKLQLAATQKRFDGKVAEHHHIRCARCGRVGDVIGTLGADVEESARGLTDYEITGHRLEFIGLCPVCRAETEALEGKPQTTGGDVS